MATNRLLMVTPHPIVLLVKVPGLQGSNVEALIQQGEAFDYQTCWGDKSQIIEICRSRPIACLLIDRAAIPENWLDWLHSIKGELQDQTPPMVVIGANDSSAAVRALKAGAENYLDQASLTVEALVEAIAEAQTTVAAPQESPAPPLPDVTSGVSTEVKNACRIMAEAMPQIVWTADAQGQINYWNQRWYEYTGLTPDESMTIAGAQIVHPEERNRTLQEWTAAIRTGQSFEIECRIRSHEGHYHWFICRALPVSHPEGQITGWIGTITDIHAHKQLEQKLIGEIEHRRETEQALRHASQRATSILENMSDAFVALDPNWKITYINQIALQLNGLTTADDLIGKSHWEVWPNTRETDAEVQYRQAIATQTPVHFEYFYPERQRWYEIHAYPSKAGLGIYFRDIHHRKQAELALAEQKERYRYIFETVNVAIWEEDFSAVKAAIEQLKQAGIEDFAAYFTQHPEFVDEAIGGVRLRNVNQAALRMFQATSKASLLQSLHQIFVPETRSAFVQELLAIASDEPFFATEAVVQTLEGTPRQLWVSMAFPPPSEPYDRVLVSLVDITEQKHAEAALQESEERFRTLADNISQFTWMADASGWIFWFNRRWFDYTGTTLEEMQGWGWRQVHHPDYVDRVVAKISHCFRTGEPWEDTFPIRSRDGEYRWFLSRALPIRDELGNILRWFGSNTDVTELKQAEAALADNEARLRGFVEANVVGILYGDIYGNIERANDEFLRIIGYSREDLANGQLDWIALTPPEFLPLDDQAIADARQRGACTPYEKEYIRKDGSRVPILIGYSLVDETREETVAFILDLSARRRAETALSRSEDRLRMAIESAQLGTWDWDLVSNDLSWDRRCKAMFGLSAETATSIETFFAGLHPEDQPKLEKIVAEALDPAGSGNYDAEFRTIGLQDGVERWLAAKGQVYFAPDRSPRRFIGTILNITERKRAEQAIRESEERLLMALEGSSGGLWDWNFVTHEDYLSPQWLAMLGYGPDDLPQQRATWEQLIHPEDKPRVLEQLQAHLRDSSVPYKFEYRLRTKDGQWKWIANYGKVVVRDAQGQPVRMSGIHHDVSDRKLIEENLRQSENRYRTLANAVSQLMWVNDPQGNIEFYNQQWQLYTGIDDLELGIGLWAQVIHPEDLENTARVREQAIATASDYEIECRLKRHDQTYRWHLARVVPLKDERGRVVSWFGTATDIHDRKCVAAEREQLLMREKAAREEAERANRIKDEFLAILSHELRSPLNPILGWSKLLQTRQFEPERTQQALATIERNAKLQTQLIDDLLDIAKILRGKLRLENSTVAVDSAIEAAIETVKTAAAAKAIALKAEIVDEVKIWGDVGRLQQIIWNLLSNAIKFTPEGGQVDIRLQQVNHQAQIQVKDTGKGINPNFLPHIFKSFHQEDLSITRKHGGLGLGLAIVRYLVEAHGGTITADSPGEGQGATFTVEFPLLNRDLTPEETQPPINDWNLAGVRILAIDDNPDACELLKTLLTQYGAEVMTVTTAIAGLDTLSTFKPDILISDIGMPDIDGFTMMRQIRELPANQGGTIPAIALTAYTREADQQRAYESGYQEHIPKPVEIERLVKAVIGLLQQ